MSRILLITAFTFWAGFHENHAQEVTAVEAPAGIATPKGVVLENFSELRGNSPFTRSLNLSDSLVLTGVATFKEGQMATLMDKETKQTYVVSSKPNAQGWKMVEIDGSNDLETVTATISVDGDSTIRVRYDEMQLKQGEARPAAGDGSTEEPGQSGKGKGSGDGKGKGKGKGDGRKGSSDIREKMSALSEEQQEAFRNKIREKFSGNPNMSAEERQQFLQKAMSEIGNQR